MDKLIPLLITFFFQASLGQGNDNLILTKEQNEVWISEIKHGPIGKQLDLIRTRILLDTNVYVRTGAPDRLRIGDESQNGKKKESFGRPLIVLNGRCDNLSPNITNKTDNKSIESLASILTESNIETVTILTYDKAMGIYGTRAAAGVFILTVTKKSICKSIKKIDFGQW